MLMQLEKGHRIGFAAVWQWIRFGLEHWLQSKANVMPNENYTNSVPFLYYLDSNSLENNFMENNPMGHAQQTGSYTFQQN